MYAWKTRELTSYTTNTDVNLGNFDIEDIVLVSPLGGSYSLPLTYNWVMRSSPSETYKLNIWDDDVNIDLYFDAGHSNSFTINCMYQGIVGGNTYNWASYVFNADGAYGIARYYSWTTIMGGPDCSKVNLPAILR